MTITLTMMTMVVMTALVMTMKTALTMTKMVKTVLMMRMTVTYQVKYAIASIRKSIAASGAMGRRVAEDVTYNSFVNTQGLTNKTGLKTTMLCRRGSHKQTLRSSC